MAESADRSGTDRRSEGRFLPTPEFQLVLKPAGLGGLLGRSEVHHWADVSEGGLQAIISGEARPGDMFRAKIVNRRTGKEQPVSLAAKHVVGSKRYPGSSVVGFRFVDPSPQLRAFVVQTFGRNPAPPRAFTSGS